MTDIGENQPVFAKRKDVLAGMIVKEDKGWILRTGGNYGADGWHFTRKKCIENGLCYGYEFFIC